MPAYQGAAGGAAAAASSGDFKLKEGREPERAEDLMGAKAMLDVPRKGNNVSSVFFTGNLMRAQCPVFLITGYQLQIMSFVCLF